MTEETSAVCLVDTLFGPQESPEAEKNEETWLDRELPFYFFDGQGDQPLLPLINLECFRPEIIEQPDISLLLPYLDELSLFEKRWGFVKKGISRDEWCCQAGTEVVPVLNELMDVCIKEMILQPRAIYAYCPCAAEGETLHLYKENQQDIFLSIPFERKRNGCCPADNFHTVADTEKDKVGLIAVTMGKNASDIAKKWLLSGHEADFHYLYGFAMEMLKAMTEYTISIMNKQACSTGSIYPLGTAKEGSGKIQSALTEVLQAQQIDITFNRNFMMMPEYSSLSLRLPF